jgi:hypothetical protein
MSKQLLAALVVPLSLLACGPLEVRIDQSKGLPTITGTVTVDVPANFTCGTTITQAPYTVTTTKTATGCSFAADQDVVLLKASDYSGIPELSGATNLVQRIELTVSQLTFTDATTSTVLDPSTRVTSATLTVNAQALISNKSQLSTLPTTVTLSGTALTSLKASIDARTAASVHASAVVELPDTPAPPAKLKIDYTVLPAVILGPGKI